MYTNIYTMYTIYCILYTTHWTLHTEHCTMHTAQKTAHTTLHTAYRHNINYTLLYSFCVLGESGYCPLSCRTAAWEHIQHLVHCYIAYALVYSINHIMYRRHISPLLFRTNKRRGWVIVGPEILEIYAFLIYYFIVFYHSLLNSLPDFLKS